MERQAPALMRFLGEDISLGVDFAGMVPLTGNYISEKKTPVSVVNELKQAGHIRQLEFIPAKRTLGDCIVVLCVCNMDAGVACGLGAGATLKLAKQAAAKQALERFHLINDPRKELSEASGDHEGAQLAAELFLEFGEKFLGNINMTILQPCGTTWKAFLRGQFQGKKLFGLSRLCETREEAVAGAGEALYYQLRATLRIPKDEPHAPKEWAEALSQEENQQTVDLGRLGIEDTQSELLEALREGEDIEKLTAALEEAMKRQEARMVDITRESNIPEDVTVGVIGRRCYEVTKPEDEHWRREEIKGKLPAEQVREQISKALEYNKVVIVSGGTGSGKSTQLPQFILDDWREWKVEGPSAEEPPTLEVDEVVEVEHEDVWYPCSILEVAEDKSTIAAKYHEGGDEEHDIDVKTRVRKSKPHWARHVPKIVVTQPRRIAAVTLAQRVAWERFGEVGGEIGYAIRGDKVFPESDSGTVEFCTVGTLLRRLISDPLLGRYNVVVLDEVHERDLMTDYLLILLKEVIAKRPDLRLVLMSATLDVETFVNYLPGCEVIEVPSGTRYPVEEIHLGDPFFEQFGESKSLLIAEEEDRKETGGKSHGSGGEHSFGIDATDTNVTSIKDSLVSEVVMLIESDDDTREEWGSFCDSVLGGEHDPSKHTEEMLRVFLSKVDEAPAQSEEETEPPSTVLAEQIQQLVSYSDEVREAWLKYVNEQQAGNKKADEWESSELLAFLAAQGVRPWKVERASWEVVSSQTWWGSSTNDTTVTALAGQVVMKVVPEMLEVHSDDEFGTGSVLVFLPGWVEIRNVAKFLEASHLAESMWVLKLHSSISKDDQQKVFETAPEGKVKVILSTNIAESSVTINDVRVVVDSGLHREVTYDPKVRMSSMETVWICQSNAVQRKGRAGRVRAGRVYRLYSKDQFESVPWRPAPEIQRCNLANTCLSTIALGRDPREFLASAPDPPMVANLESAMSELSSIEAIQDGVPPQMLPIGQVISRMPLEPLLGRAMMLGTLFGIPQLSAAIVTASTGSTVFIDTPDRRQETTAIRREYCSWSDVVSNLRALVEFENVFREHGEGSARQWADSYFLNYQRLVTMSRIKFQLLEDVTRSGLISAADTDGMDPEDWMHGGDEGQAFWEAESEGAIVDAGEMTSGMDRPAWIEELRNSNREVEDERLLVGMLCHAYPTNLAVRSTRSGKIHMTSTGTKAIISRRSVNGNIGKQADSGDMDWLPEPSWWLYGDARLFQGQLTLSDTTYISNWNLALFSGLRVKEDGDSLNIDGWIGIRGQTPEVEELIRRLRQEIRQALMWVAIATSYDRIAMAATMRAKALLKVVGRVLMGSKPEEEDLETIRTWRLPEETDSSLATVEESREEVESKLHQKTVAELKVLLREFGARVSGRKADLVSRCADYLMYGKEGEAEQEEWDE